MATPITWRNVGATVNGGGVGSLLESARRSADSGFGALQSVLDDAQETADANREVIKGNNTADFLRTLNSYDSAEDYQAALESGELDQQLDSYGRAINPDVVQQMFTQGSRYRDRDTSRNLFADDQTLRAQRGLEDEIQKDIAAGRMDEARTKTEQLQMNSGEFAQSIRDAEVNREKLARDEGRYRLAQAAGARANQAHQVSMREAALREQDRKQTELTQNLAYNGLQTHQQQKEGYLQGVAEVMQDLGLKGSFNDLDPKEDKPRVVRELEERGITPPPTDSEFIRAFTDQVANGGELDPGSMVKLTASLDQLISQDGKLATSDQAKLETKKAKLAATRAYNQSNNLFYDSRSASEQSEAINETIDNTFDSWNILSIGTNREEAKDFFNDWAANGVDTTIQTKDPETGDVVEREVTVPLTARAVEEIFKYSDADDGYFVKSDAEAWVKNNAAELLKASLLKTQDQHDTQALLDLQRSLKSSKYGDVSVSDDIIDAMR